MNRTSSVLLALTSLAPALPAQVTWERQEEFRIISEAHAFDQRRGRLVHQSATSVADFPGDRTWEWLGEGPDQGWIERFPGQSPGPRNGRLAFDYARGKVVVFGTRLSPLNDLWEWDGNTWTQVNWTVGSTPNPFSNICFVSDPVRKKIVLVGSVHFWETWEWDGAQWTSFGPDNPPIENAGAFDAAFNPYSNRVAITSNILREWDGSSWIQPPGVTNLPPLGPPGGFLNNRKLVPDYVHGSLLMLLQYVSSPSSGPVPGPPQIDIRMLEWKGTWTDITPTVVANGPMPPYLSPISVDRTNKVAIMPLLRSGQSGYEVAGRASSGEVWLFDLRERRWRFQRIQKPTMPEPAVVHDSGNDRFLLVGGGYEFPGTTSTMETWSYSPERGYRPVATPTRPPTRSTAYGLSKHIGSGKVILFGDYDPTAFSHDQRTWVFDGRDWTGTVLSPSPDANHVFQAAYDSIRDRVLMFGWQGGGFWSWTPAGWTQLPSVPSDPVAGFLTFDSARDRAVLWEPVDGIQEFHPSTGWVSVPSGAGTTNAPLGWPLAFEYAPEFGGVIHAGGTGGTPQADRADDTWLWDGTSWTLLQDGGPEGILPAPSQPFRRHQAAYDPERQRIIEFGNLSTVTETDYNQILARRQLLFSGREVRRGDVATLSYSEPRDSNNLWLVLISASAREGLPIKPSGYSPLVQTRIPIDPDPLFFASLALGPTAVLDAQGQGSVSFAIPNDPVLDWQQIHAASITFGPTGIQTISDRTTVRIVPDR